MTTGNFWLDVYVGATAASTVLMGLWFLAAGISGFLAERKEWRDKWR